MPTLQHNKLFHYLLFIIFLFSAATVSAEDAEEIIIRFKTIDRVTNRSIYMLDIELFAAEDTSYVGRFYNVDRYHQCETSKIKPGASYLIKIDNSEQNSDYSSYNEALIKQGEYEQVWIPVTIPKDKKIIELPTVRLSRPNRKAPEQLKEVTVTASKVMFYHRGDTLVYNADAFLLSEGSMLDALIKQLPGVELKSDGRIYCNGKYVEQLLLNGRDLFNGNNELMLENLAAYTVKNIAVYDKLGRNSKLIGAEIDGDKKYVMDVRLKRQYANGWIINAEGGYGTKERYLGKFFGLWFTNNASITAIAGANNLSDQKDPGREDASWSPDDMSGGVSTRIHGGFIYTVEGPEDKWNFRGDVKYNQYKFSSITNTNRQNYYDTGDTYNYSWRNSQNRSWNFSTNHHLNATLADKVNIYVNPRFSYQKRDMAEASTEALFSREIRDISEQMVKNIYNAGDTLSQHFINRNLREAFTNNKGLETGIQMSAFVPITGESKNRQTLSVTANLNYINREESRANQYCIDYANAPSSSDKALQIFRGNPHWDKRASVTAKYMKFLNSTSRELGIDYGYYFLAERRTEILYLLDQMSGYDFNSPVSQLPSMREYAPFIDADQSNTIRYNQHVHEIYPHYFQKFELKENTNLWTSITLPVEIWSRVMYYRWPELDKLETIKRDNVKLGFRSSFNFSHTPDDSRWAITNLSVNLKPVMSPLLYIVDRVNNTDPLNIMKGNPDLHDSYEFNVSLNTQHGHPNGGRLYHYGSLSYSTVFNQFARGYLYDPATGVRTYRTYNINGNWNLYASYQFGLQFGKNKMFKLQATTSPVYSHSVDFAGASGEETDNMPPRRKVDNLSLGETIKLDWLFGRNRLTANVMARANRYNSSDMGFSDFTSWTCNYGISELINLPHNWGISSDLTLYTRRGFTDSRLNTTDLVWNARVTKSVMKGSLVLAVDAYDLLHQLSNINYAVNAQAKTEVVSNVIPAYVLFHIQWRFNKQPKKW